MVLLLEDLVVLVDKQRVMEDYMVAVEEEKRMILLEVVGLVVKVP